MQGGSESDRDYCPDEDTDSNTGKRISSVYVPLTTRKSSKASAHHLGLAMAPSDIQAKFYILLR